MQKQEAPFVEDSMLETSQFDAAKYIKTEEEAKAYLEEAASENDPFAYAEALKTVAKARASMAQSEQL